MQMLDVLNEAPGRIVAGFACRTGVVAGLCKEKNKTFCGKYLVSLQKAVIFN